MHIDNVNRMVLLRDFGIGYPEGGRPTDLTHPLGFSSSCCERDDLYGYEHFSQ